MALHLKLSTALVVVLVLGALAPIEVTEAAKPFSLRNLKDLLKSVIDLASFQQRPNRDHHHPPGGEHQRHHRVMPTMAATTPLADMSREELEDVLEAQLQEVQSRNGTNETLGDDDDLAGNRTEGYDAENSTIVTEPSKETSKPVTEPPEETSKPSTEPPGETSKPGTEPPGETSRPNTEPLEEKSKSKEGSKEMIRAHEEGVGLGSRPCNHFFDFGRSELPKKLRKIYEYGQRIFTTMERPTTESEEETEPATIEPSEMEPEMTVEPSEVEPLETMEPSDIEPGTTEPEEIEALTLEPTFFEPTVTGKLQEERKLMSYMRAQGHQAVYNMVEVQTPHTRTTVVYIPVNRNGKFGMV